MTYNAGFPKTVEFIEVCLRDGLQNESRHLTTEQKITLVNDLLNCGFKHIEVSSFVNPQIIPQLYDAEELFKALDLKADVVFSALVANQKGLYRALDCGVKHLALFTAASEIFCQKNINCSIQQSLQRFQNIISLARKQYPITFRAYISCAWDCPYSGSSKIEQVMNLATELMNIGCDEIVLADTTGKASPLQVEQLLRQMLELRIGHSLTRIKVSQLAVHFHNTYGMALANIVIALQQGIYRIDSSIAGLGGCPTSPRAGGNVPSEDLLFMLNAMGIKTGVDLNQAIGLGRKLADDLKRKNLSLLGELAVEN